MDIKEEPKEPILTEESPPQPLDKGRKREHTPEDKAGWGTKKLKVADDAAPVQREFQKKRIALLFGYCGANYVGLQRYVGLLPCINLSEIRGI